MRNVTITLPEEVARWARVWAARQDMSLSRFVGELLRRRMDKERGYERSLRQFLSRPASRLSKDRGYPNREELHDRPRLR